VYTFRPRNAFFLFSFSKLIHIIFLSFLLIFFLSLFINQREKFAFVIPRVLPLFVAKNWVLPFAASPPMMLYLPLLSASFSFATLLSSKPWRCISACLWHLSSPTFAVSPFFPRACAASRMVKRSAIVSLIFRFSPPSHAFCISFLQ